MDTPQADDLLFWVAAIATSLLSVVAFMVFVKNWLLSDIRSDISEMKGQLHRNGGTSLRDAVDRIEERQSVMTEDVRRATDRLDSHITFHLEEK